MHTKTIAVIPLLLLVGCAGPGAKLGTIAGGECRIVHTPKYAVLGKTAYDRDWIETTEESLVRGCNQPRPLARPRSLDMPVKARPIISEQPESSAMPVKPKKRHWWQRKKKPPMT